MRVARRQKGAASIAASREGVSNRRARVRRERAAWMAKGSTGAHPTMGAVIAAAAARASGAMERPRA